MSTAMIAGLIVAGIVLLLLISYIVQIIEKNKLEKARARADLLDRIQRSRAVNESLPGQLLKPALKLLLCRLEAFYCEQLIALNKTEPQIAARLNELRQHIAQGTSIAVNNPPQAINSEIKAKDVRLTLENLLALINRAQHDHFLKAAEAQQWVAEIRHLQIRLHLEFFNSIGQQMMSAGKPGQARLAYERGVQYLRKQPEVSAYKAQLDELQQQLAKADAVVLEKNVHTRQESSELNDALKNLDDDWKKKNFYD